MRVMQNVKCFKIQNKIWEKVYNMIYRLHQIKFKFKKEGKGITRQIKEKHEIIKY